MRKPELLAPAGDMEKLKMAVLYGADAVYLAGTSFGMRSFAGNFDDDELPRAVAYAHAHGVRVHATVNTMPRGDELPALPAHLRLLNDSGVDALILADLGVFRMAQREAPNCELHVSTQVSIANAACAAAWHELGAKRVVSARELSLKEIKEIREHIPEDMEIESFIHGAMCISYSGRCLLSNFLTGRDANQGACTHPCRWKYAVAEETRPGEWMPVYENERGSYIFNSRDLCMIEHIPEMVEAGIDSFKIEGRMKTALYVATVARTYRIAIDDYLESPEKYQSKMEWYKSEIRKCTHREYITGFYFHKPGTESQVYGSNTYVKPYTYLGTVGAVRGDGLVHLEQKNKFSVGETIEIMKPDGRNLRVEVKGIFTEDGTAQESAPHPKQQLWVDLGGMAEPQDILRREDEALDL